MKSSLRKCLSLICFCMMLLSVSTVVQAYIDIYDVFEQVLDVEYTKIVAYGDHYVMLEKKEEGFADTVYYYGIYDFAKREWCMEYQELEGTPEDSRYVGEGVFDIPMPDGAILWDATVKEGNFISGVNRSNLYFQDGLSVNYTSCSEVPYRDICCIYSWGTYYPTGIAAEYPNDANVIYDYFFRNEKYAVFIFNYSTFVIFNIDYEYYYLIEAPDYAGKFTTYSSEARLEMAGDYLVLMDMEGNDGKNYYAVFTLDGEEYIPATVCKGVFVTEKGNLVVITEDEDVEEILLVDQAPQSEPNIADLAEYYMGDYYNKRDYSNLEMAVTDKNGELYLNPVIYYESELFGNAEYHRSATYFLGGNYDTFSGTLFLPEQAVDGYGMLVRVMGDEKVLYEFQELKDNACREDFEISVEGVQQIRLEFDGVAGSDPIFGLANTQFIGEMVEESEILTEEIAILDPAIEVIQEEAEKLFSRGEYVQAISWYEKGAELGDVSSMSWLGDLYFYYSDGEEEDYERAAYWYEKAGEAGDGKSMMTLASMYFYGEGVEQDYLESVSWYEKAADAGMIYAMERLAGMYEMGEGVTQDYEKAVYWYERAQQAYE